MAEKRERILRTTLIIVGLIATVFSFVYYFALKCPNDVVFEIICTTDLALFFVNMFWLALFYKKIKKGRAWCAVMFMLIYFGLFQLLGILLAWGEAYSIERFKNAFFVSLFLSPSIMIVLPVLGLIFEYM